MWLNCQIYKEIVQILGSLRSHVKNEFDHDLNCYFSYMTFNMCTLEANKIALSFKYDMNAASF